MNTLFKFFIQVWVLWGMAGAIMLPRLWAGRRVAHAATDDERQGDRAEGDLPIDVPQMQSEDADSGGAPPRRPSRGFQWALVGVWRIVVVILLILSSTFLVLGTPARLSQRMVGWRPPIGTLDGLAFMEQGSYTWPSDANRIELRYDREAIGWLLDNVRGNLVIVESAEVDYYRAGGTRVASMTGLSGLRGMHAGEQRPGVQVGERDALHREFWSTPSVERTQALLDELQVSLVYVGPLERQQHPDGVSKLAGMAAQGQLTPVFENTGVVIYAVPGRLGEQNLGLLTQ